MPWTQEDTSFKKLQNKRITTSSGKGIDEEKGASTLELYLPDVKTDEIPGVPPGASTDVLIYTGAIGQTLVVDTSVPSNLTWFATTGYGNTTVANDGSQSSESARLMNWISDKYDGFGTVSGAGYEIKVYDKNSNLITKSDASDWLFDYQTGILVFNNSTLSNGNPVSTSGPYRIVGYRYNGRKGIIPTNYGGLGISLSSLSLGTLLVGAGSSVIPFASGSNNYILTSDSISASGLTWSDKVGLATTAQNINVNYSDEDISNYLIFSKNYSGSGIALSSNNTISFNPYTYKLSVPGLAVTSTTASTNTSSGSLVVSGGVGIGGSLFVGGIGASISGLIISNSVITSGSWAGTAITSAYGGFGPIPVVSTGDILVGSGNTWYNLPVSASSNYVLTVDSGSPFGVKWAAPTSGTASSTVDVVSTNEDRIFYPVFVSTPSQTGIALSSDSNLTYNASSNLLSIGSLSGSAISITNASNYVRFIYSGSSTTTYTLPANSPQSSVGTSVLSSTVDGILSWVPLSASGVGTVGNGTSPRLAYYQTSGTAITDTYGINYNVSGTASTFSIFGGASLGSTIFIVQALSQNSIKVGIGLTNPAYELEVVGEISATNKSFVIDHPTKQGMKLRYGSLEGPENGVYVRGELKNDNIISTPDYWTGLVDQKSFTVHLTPIGNYQQLYVEKIENFKVYVGAANSSTVHCFYSIWAERVDVPKLLVEY